MWGFGNLDIIERVQLKFLKFILKSKRSTSNDMIYGETGCMPLRLDIEEGIISFWFRILSYLYLIYVSLLNVFSCFVFYLISSCMYII